MVLLAAPHNVIVRPTAIVLVTPVLMEEKDVPHILIWMWLIWVFV